MNFDAGEKLIRGLDSLLLDSNLKIQTLILGEDMFKQCTHFVKNVMCPELNLDFINRDNQFVIDLGLFNSVIIKKETKCNIFLLKEEVNGVKKVRN